jgi:hypothetical protein
VVGVAMSGWFMGRNSAKQEKPFDWWTSRLSAEMSTGSQGRAAWKGKPERCASATDTKREHVHGLTGWTRTSSSASHRTAALAPKACSV